MSDERLRRIAAICLCVLTTLCLYSLLSHSEERLDGENPDDFVKYYLMSDRMVRGGELYAPLSTSSELVERIGWSWRSDRPADPPSLSLITYPLSLVSYRAAWWCVLACSIMCIFGAVFVVVREFGGSSVQGGVLGFIALGTIPCFVLLSLNHIEGLLCPLVVATVVALRRGRVFQAGVWWGILVCLKLFPAYGVIFFLKRRYSRFLWGFSCAVAVLSGVTTLLLGMDVWRDFIFLVIPQASQFLASNGNFSLIGLCYQLGRPVLAYVVVLCFLAWTAYLWSRKDSCDASNWVRAVSLPLLISPLSWSYYYIILLPVFAAILVSPQQRRVYVGLMLSALFVLYSPSLLGGWFELNNIYTALQVELKILPPLGVFWLINYAWFLKEGES